MGITASFSRPFFRGGARSSEVPARYDVALAGHPFVVDWQSGLYQETSIALVRTQADASDRPGEQTINPEDFWRRSVDGWHRGAGQRHLDRPDSQADRFWKSVGVDPWTKGQLSVLPAAEAKTLTATTNDRLAVAGARLYWVSGSTLKYTTDITAASPTFTTVTTGGTAISSAKSITSDGKNVYVSDGTDTYYTVNTTTTYATATGGGGSARPASVIRYTKGRVMHADGRVWSELRGTLGAMTLAGIYTHRNADFVWVDFVGGANHIYAAGFSGDKSLIYRTALANDAADLAAPVVAAELPDGEIVRSLGAYLGFVLIGTDRGVRFAVPGTDGSLTVGDLIVTPNAVRCFEGQDRFVWFGLVGYESVYAGLGRLDLRTLNGTAPAWASDMVLQTAATAVLSVVTFQRRRVFSMTFSASAIVYAEGTARTTTAWVSSGLIGYNLTEPKTALYLDTRHAAGAGSYQAAIATDEAAFANVGPSVVTSNVVAGRFSTATGQRDGEQFEVRYTFARDGTDLTAAPILNRWTLKAEPRAPRRSRRTVPLLLHRQVIGRDGSMIAVDPRFARDVLTSLWAARTVFTFQEGITSSSVILDDYQWVPYQPADFPSWTTDGTFVVVLKSV